MGAATTVTAETVDGSQTAEETFELTIGAAADACSCNEFETHIMVVQSLALRPLFSF